MGNKINDPIARLMGLRYKSHQTSYRVVNLITHITFVLNLFIGVK